MTDELVRKLKSFRVYHREYERVCEDSFAHAALGAPGSIILIVGPTNAGKTSILSNLKKRLVLPKEKWTDGEIPIAGVKIRNTDGGLFSSKDFVTRCLAAVEHPGFTMSAAEGGCYEPRGSFAETRLHRMFERSLEARKTKYFLVDDAQHFLLSGSARKAAHHLDTLKSLCTNTEVTLVLAGTYHFLEAWNLSAQMNARLTEIHFPAYGTDRADLLEFERILECFEPHVPLAPSQTLREWRKTLHYGTCGTVGILARWLEKAIKQMHARKECCVSYEVLRATAWRQSQVDRMLTEIRFGLACMNDPFEEFENAALEVPAPVRKSKPFVRKPGRDPVPAGAIP
ncbi:TniB family NTP-binding protein [Dokdonella soli]|uniref:AAA+ ATPase domain-containing protein n=1 Tax=Dokdonella soli TaxID=529810 RepID=A0ABN1IGY1_9GAMM